MFVGGFMMKNYSREFKVARQQNDEVALKQSSNKT
jgi:hypothetical protein